MSCDVAESEEQIGRIMTDVQALQQELTLRTQPPPQPIETGSVELSVSD